MADNDTDNPQIYAIDEQDSTEPSGDKVEILGFEGALFTESNGTATLDSSVDAVDLGNADAKNVDRFEYNVAVDSLGEADPASTVTIDVSKRSVWELVVDGDTEIGFTGAADDGVYSATVFIEHTGSETITFASDVTFDDNNGTPDFSTAGEVAVSVFSRDGGSSWKALSGGVWT
ncbi:hypothetical protein [Natrialba asiatica]|uniref:Uncharacterized protein n=1 Tax=Natrialba asiatica (strain ATCC 700177 / DSM 12278 / JCM 9576 / FERM P-10747 / NBRC 102637 / 172P1) TaxID=29540 RepID=M0AEH8_NATA1|nr:hypothetical protein [Natrialba asiatica]ELY97145.1 hypothetical protein C481_21191 [Natrialba asiatica DSM 12278]